MTCRIHSMLLLLTSPVWILQVEESHFSIGVVREGEIYSGVNCPHNNTCRRDCYLRPLKDLNKT